MKTILASLSHLALFAGVYVASGVVCFAQVAGAGGDKEHVGLGVGAGWLAMAFCVAIAVYLLDRVKLRDRWLDPADLEAHPARYVYLRGRTRLARGLALAAVVVATALCWKLGGGRATWLLLVPPVALIGGMVYAAGPRRVKARPKDRLFLKNGYVASGITGCAALITIASAVKPLSVGGVWAYGYSHVAALALAGVLLWVRVFADAVLCDLDDLAADKEFGTRTLPNWLGHGRAWNLAMGVRLVLAAALAAIGLWGRVLPRDAALAWAAATAGSSVLLRVIAPGRVREWVDARFGIEVLVVAAVLGVIGN